jgi:hypothetical protein
MAGALPDYIMNRILSEVRARVKVERSSDDDDLTGRTLERIELDETAVGTMGIEWMSQPALSRAEEECVAAGDW